MKKFIFKLIRDSFGLENEDSNWNKAMNQLGMREKHEKAVNEAKEDFEREQARYKGNENSKNSNSSSESDSEKIAA